MREAERAVRSLGHLLSWFVAPAIGAAAGVVYCAVFNIGVPAHMALRGALIGTPILLYERSLLLPRWRDQVRRAATPIFAVTTMLIYGLMIVGGNFITNAALHGLGLMDSSRVMMIMTESGFAYAFVASALVIFVFRVRDLIGPGVFANLLLGLYHRPLHEERIFLFLDISGSTAFADRHGDLAAQEYLGQIFNALAGPVRRSGGSIDDYVGDMALVTWTMRRGLENAACLRCVAAFTEVIERDATVWKVRFGQVPRFRAALHCGPVVTAEIGLERHKIAYFGDAVNTTARLEVLSKALGTSVLISADLAGRLGPLPEGFSTQDLGMHAIRGREEALAVVAIGLPFADAPSQPYRVIAPENLAPAQGVH